MKKAFGEKYEISYEFGIWRKIRNLLNSIKTYGMLGA
jgi:hypothetical protein